MRSLLQRTRQCLRRTTQPPQKNEASQETTTCTGTGQAPARTSTPDCPVQGAPNLQCARLRRVPPPGSAQKTPLQGTVANIWRGQGRRWGAACVYMQHGSKLDPHGVTLRKCAPTVPRQTQALPAGFAVLHSLPLPVGLAPWHPILSLSPLSELHACPQGHYAVSLCWAPEAQHSQIWTEYHIHTRV